MCFKLNLQFSCTGEAVDMMIKKRQGIYVLHGPCSGLRLLASIDLISETTRAVGAPLIMYIRQHRNNTPSICISNRSPRHEENLGSIL